MVISFKTDRRLGDGAYSVVYELNGRAFKLFKRYPQVPPRQTEEGRRLTYQHQCEAYELASCDSLLKHHIATFYGRVAIEDVIDTDGRSVKDSYLLDCCYARTMPRNSGGGNGTGSGPAASLWRLLVAKKPNWRPHFAYLKLRGSPTSRKQPTDLRRLGLKLSIHPSSKLVIPNSSSLSTLNFRTTEHVVILQCDSRVGVYIAFLTFCPIQFTWEELSHDAQQCGWKEGFLHELKIRIRPCISRNQNDRHSGEGRFDGLGKTQAVAIGHLDITDDQIHAAAKFLYNLEGVGTVLGFQSSKVFPLQDRAHVPPN
ncbi:MAG: hypothetical protein ABSG03_20730 [Bryobacteraceae bacterium]|jgi:hypothetical protein